MKHLLLLLAILATGILHAQEEEDYQMYQTIVLTPHDGHSQQLFDAVKAHNDQFHQEGKESVNVWGIENGPSTGSLLWVKGPITWSDMDTPIEGDAHMDDWYANVMQHASMETMEFWRHWDGLSYMPEGFTPRLMVIRYFEVEEQKWNNVEHVWSTVFKLYEEKEWDTGLRVFYNAANEGDGRDLAVVWYHENWSSMDADRNFFAQYEEAYDIDRREYFENWNDITNYKGMLIFNLIDELSVIGSDG